MMFVFGGKGMAVRLQCHNILVKQMILLCFKTVTNNLFFYPFVDFFLAFESRLRRNDYICKHKIAIT